MQSQLLQVTSKVQKDNISNKNKIWSIRQKDDKQNIIQKIILLDKGGSAIILKNDNNKPIRFLYLCLLMSKKNSFNLSAMISKMNEIRMKINEIMFFSLSQQIKLTFNNNPFLLYQNLLQLHKRMQLHKFSQSFIINLILQSPFIDPLLILSIRAISFSYNIISSLDYSSTLTLGQVQLILNKFFVDKGVITNHRNKYVVFWGFESWEIKNIKDKAVLIQNQKESYQEIVDNFIGKTQNFVMIEKVFSILDQNIN